MDGKFLAGYGDDKAAKGPGGRLEQT